MARLFAIFLLVALSVQTFQQTLLVLDYRLNRKAFAANCTNKARPQLKCKGKCQLMKKLAAEEKKKEQTPERKLEHRPEVVYAAHSFPPLLPLVASNCPTPYPDYLAGTLAYRSPSIFHPPARL